MRVCHSRGVVPAVTLLFLHCGPTVAYNTNYFLSFSVFFYSFSSSFSSFYLFLSLVEILDLSLSLSLSLSLINSLLVFLSFFFQTSRLKREEGRRMEKAKGTVTLRRVTREMERKTSQLLSCFRTRHVLSQAGTKSLKGLERCDQE